jgi:FtsP/CotA-like multicopper oxidase with cupredoxin domain
MQSTRTTRWYRPPWIQAPLAALLMLGLAACGQAGATTAAGGDTAAATDPNAVGPSTAPRLDPNTIPKFVNQLERLPKFLSKVTRDSTGRITAKEFTVEIAKDFEQQLPPPLPQTLVFTYGGQTVDGFGRNPGFRRSSPGPTFEQTRGAPATIHYLNELLGQHPLAVDPTLDWANPNNFPKPTPPFNPFPPGYPEAQSPIPHVTHTHGIEVLPHFDGTPDLWFTENGIVGPEFVSNTYLQPSTNESSAFWYHDHSFGVTRLDVGMGLNGFSILRDPNNPLDRVGNADTLGFEDPYMWRSDTASIVPRLDSRHTEGVTSVAIDAKGFSVLTGATFPVTALPSTVSMDFFLPSQQPNPFWFGAVQLYADCPSNGVTNAFIGQVELTGKPLNTFSRLSFSIPAAIRSSVGICDDFNFRVAVNVPTNATGTYLLDNFLGIPKVAGTPLPTGEFEVPLIVGDRSFRTDGSIFYPIAQEQPPGTLGANPDVNPYWMLIINGDTNIVNGKVWPNMNVKRHAYRFRQLVAANQRFYRFSLSNGMPITVIGTDGGYKRTPEVVTSFLQGVTERVDYILDFSKFAPGTKIVMLNTEQRNPPVGPAPDPNTDGIVMQFTVEGGQAIPPKPLPGTLNNIASLTPNRPTRNLIQNVESDDQGRVLQAELDGQLFHTLTTELPTIGATEDWDFINLTPLTHNKHVHLIEFLVVSRQTFDNARYLRDWLAINGNPPFTHPTLKLDPTPYLTGTPEGPLPEENGWKDTVRTPAMQVTRIRIRWNPQSAPTGAGAPGVNLFNFDPVDGVGYIWHCHLLEHEDNEMMRPMTVVPTWAPGVFYPVGFRGSPGVQRGLVDFNGIDYQARVAHTSNAAQPPPTRPDLWERVNNQNGDWAVQIIYNVGDRVLFQGHVYRALQKHQARAGLEPTNAPNLWSLVL